LLLKKNCTFGAGWQVCQVLRLLAKLPAPSVEAKAKVAETAAKAVWTGKVDTFRSASPKIK
jgi:hypothetical protein